MCSRTELDRAISDARLTDQQWEIVELMFIRGLSGAGTVASVNVAIHQVA